MTTKEKILKLFETSQRRIFFRRRYCPKTMLQNKLSELLQWLPLQCASQLKPYLMRRLRLNG